MRQSQGLGWGLLNTPPRGAMVHSVARRLTTVGPAPGWRAGLAADNRTVSWTDVAGEATNSFLSRKRYRRTNSAPAGVRRFINLKALDWSLGRSTAPPARRPSLARPVNDGRAFARVVGRIICGDSHRILMAWCSCRLSAHTGQPEALQRTSAP